MSGAARPGRRMPRPMIQGRDPAAVGESNVLPGKGRRHIAVLRGRPGGRGAPAAAGASRNRQAKTRPRAAPETPVILGGARSPAVPTSLDVMESDIAREPAAVSAFSPPPALGAAEQRRAVFCGSGDSLAACMLAEAFSPHGARAADPLDLLKFPGSAAGRDLYVVSVSGRTVSNVRAAREAAEREGPGATAITSRPESPLAGACARTVRLQMGNTDAVTAGTISFVDAALTCVSLVGGFERCDAAALFAEAGEAAARFPAPGGRGAVTFLGNRMTYPLAMYAAAKMAEVLGADARYERIEQFSHMGLFSSRPGDTAVILEGDNDHSGRLAASLERAGLRVVRAGGGAGAGPVGQALFLAFLAQLVPLRMARAEGRTECHFLADDAQLGASNRMIY